MSRVDDRVVALAPGDVVWAELGETSGREQSGRRPALVVSGADYLDVVTRLAMVVPITSVDRGWPNHVAVTGSSLRGASWAMSEQMRTIARERIARTAGRADAATLASVRRWLRDFLDL
ncbi:MAG: type II toxin-antitoxin system PemK/MazF family toxin [Actinomycetales bacterium]|nr:type II toxin-antitoxin system PemK/MazF family toxin [Actinomycetales bacterium]